MFINLIFIALFLASYPCWLMARLPYSQILLFIILGLYALFVLSSQKKILKVKSLMFSYKGLNILILAILVYLIINGVFLSGGFKNLFITLSSLTKILFFYLLVLSFGTDVEKVENKVLKISHFLLIFATYFSIVGILLFILLFIGVNVPSRELGSVIKVFEGSSYKDFYFLGHAKAIWGDLTPGVGEFVRIQSFFSEPGDFALFLGVPIFMALAFINSSANKILYIIMFLINLVAFLLTLSIVGFISFGIPLMLLLITARKKEVGKYLFIAALIFGLFILIYYTGVYDQISGSYSFQRMTRLGSTDQRWASFVNGINMFIANPLFGVGFNNQDETLSQYLTLLVDLGIIGAMLFALFFYLVIKYIIRNILCSDQAAYPLGRYVSFGFIGNLIWFVFNGGLFTYYTWFLIGLVVAINYSVGQKMKIRRIRSVNE